MLSQQKIELGARECARDMMDGVEQRWCELNECLGVLYLRVMAG